MPGRAKLLEGDPTSNKVFVFESDPSEFLGGPVPVYIDSDDPRRYLVDTSFLPSPGDVPDPEESRRARDCGLVFPARRPCRRVVRALGVPEGACVPPGPGRLTPQATRGLATGGRLPGR